MSDAIDVRPISVDILVTQVEDQVAQRRVRIEGHLKTYGEQCDRLRASLQAAESMFKFLQQEHANVVLVQRLQAGDVVRVVCTGCQGTGLKPTDVTSGQIHRKSAFETVGDTQRVKVLTPMEADPKDRCTVCEGKRYQLMERYRS